MPYPPVPYPPIASLTTPATPPRVKANSCSLSETVSSSPTTASASSPPLSTPIFQPFVFPRPSPAAFKAPPPSPYSSKSSFFLQLERTRTIESPPSSSPSKQGRFGKFRPPKKTVKRDRDEAKEMSAQESGDAEVREVLERTKRRRLEASANDGKGNDAQDARIAISGDRSSPHQGSDHLEIDSPSPHSPSPSPSIAPTSNPIPHRIPFNHPRLINQHVSLRKKKKEEKEKGRKQTSKNEKTESSEDELMIALDQLIASTKKKRERKN